ncbi:MAG: hypothetical protein PVJ57_16200 [Phycisphaerae bacterium]|jgi:hypothetical protein
MKRHAKILLLSLVIVGAIAFHVVRHVRETSFDEAAHRDTTHLRTEKVTWEATGAGCVVRGVLVNEDARSASSVVLLVQLLDEAGAVQAANPMVEVLDVPPQGDREFEVFLPAKSVPPNATVVVKAVVVCWEE